MTVLQTVALPLGYVTAQTINNITKLLLLYKKTPAFVESGVFKEEYI